MTSREVSILSEGDTIDDHADDSKPDLDELAAEELDPVDAGPLSRRTPGSTRRSTRPRTSTGTAPATATATGKKAKARKSAAWMQTPGHDGTEDEGSIISIGPAKGKKLDASPDDESRTVGTAVGTRRQPNGTVGSVYSGSKIRHIKKPDGTPLWRKEIQHDFLRTVIDDPQPVFTRISDGTRHCTFADIYVDCMARSSKTSKILKDRLQIDRHAAKNMAMICLLVNVGRMNTTLNFFPEMRAQLRTYHSIPSLQAYKSQRDYKSLQDAPRLKSILKGASEDTEEPRTLEALQDAAVPRTNPVNLIFVLSQYAPKVSETHFTNKVDFFDLAMRATISSASRARAFLWLMWWYLESDFTKAAALANPYGPGEYKDDEDPDDAATLPLLVPQLVTLTDEEAERENQDTPEEVAFADKMTAERKRIMLEVASEPPLVMADPGNADHKAVRRLKKSVAAAAGPADDDSLMSDADSHVSPGPGLARSPGRDSVDPHGAHGHVMTALGGQADSLDDDWEAVDPHPGRGRYKRVKGKNTPARAKGGKRGDGPKSSAKKSKRKHGTPDTYEQSRGTPQLYQPGSVFSHTSYMDLAGLRGETDGDHAGAAAKGAKSRARTGYQRELEEHRQRRVEWALRKKRRQILAEARARREGERWFTRAARRITGVDATYDSEEEDEAGGAMLAGLLGPRWVGDRDGGAAPAGFEVNDDGEEAEMWAKVLKRTARRLAVWGGDRDEAGYPARPRRRPLSEDMDLAPPPPTVPTRAPARAASAKKVKKKGKRASPVRSRSRREERERSKKMAAAAAAAAVERDLNDEITQDLLAERSDDDMDDDDDSVDIDGDEIDVDMY